MAQKTPTVADIMQFIAPRRRFSTDDINQAFDLETPNTAAYLAIMRRRGSIQPAVPAKIDGVSQWTYVGGGETAEAVKVNNLLRCIIEVKRAGVGPEVSKLITAAASGAVASNDITSLLADVEQAQAS